MTLIRDYLNTYQRITSTKWNRLSRQAWGTVAVALSSLFRGADGETAEVTFIGDAARPVATGASTIELLPGLALWRDDAEADPWEGKLKPIFLEQAVTVPIETNNDAGGHDRIDRVVIRHALVDADFGDVRVKDPDSGVKAWATLPQAERHSFEFKVIGGIPAANPEPPETPEGWAPVADVYRPHAQAAVATGDISDIRPLESIRLNGLSALASLIIGDASNPNGSIKLRPSVSDPRVLVIANEADDPAGLEVEKLNAVEVDAEAMAADVIDATHISANAVSASEALIVGDYDIEDSSKTDWVRFVYDVANNTVEVLRATSLSSTANISVDELSATSVNSIGNIETQGDVIANRVRLGGSTSYLASSWNHIDYDNNTVMATTDPSGRADLPFAAKEVIVDEAVSANRIEMEGALTINDRLPLRSRSGLKIGFDARNTAWAFGVFGYDSTASEWVALSSYRLSVGSVDNNAFQFDLLEQVPSGDTAIAVATIGSSSGIGQYTPYLVGARGHSNMVEVFFHDVTPGSIPTTSIHDNTLLNLVVYTARSA